MLNRCWRAGTKKIGRPQRRSSLECSRHVSMRDSSHHITYTSLFLEEVDFGSFEGSATSTLPQSRVQNLMPRLNHRSAKTVSLVLQCPSLALRILRLFVRYIPNATLLLSCVGGTVDCWPGSFDDHVLAGPFIVTVPFLSIFRFPTCTFSTDVCAVLGVHAASDQLCRTPQSVCVYYSGLSDWPCVLTKNNFDLKWSRPSCVYSESNLHDLFDEKTPRCYSRWHSLFEPLFSEMHETFYQTNKQLDALSQHLRAPSPAGVRPCHRPLWRCPTRSGHQVAKARASLQRRISQSAN